MIQLRWTANPFTFRIINIYDIGEMRAMNRRYRKTIIAGNWKMNKDRKSVV